MVEDIRENQPHILVTIENGVNVIGLTDLRFRMNDKNESLLMRCLCKAVIDAYGKSEGEAL